MPTPMPDNHLATAEITALHEHIDMLAHFLLRAHGAARTARQLAIHYRVEDGRPPRALDDALATLRHDVTMAMGTLDQAAHELRELEWHAAHRHGPGAANTEHTIGGL